ncbi:MAG: mechanosensitive ion channel family protein [Gammaproteobacteria bacterium]
MFDWLGNEAWLAWGVGLLIGFPLLMVLFGEMLYRLEDTKNSRHSIITNAQYFVFPSLTIYLLLSQVLELTHDHLIIKIVASIFWISILYLSISTFNILWSGKSSNENAWQSRIPNLILNIARLFFILLGIAFVISAIWGIDLGQMLAALGVGSIVLGLALQDTLGGLFAGITLISARQFQIGDWIKAGDVVGQVISINWHSVTLKSFEEDLLVIPNSVLASNIFYNFSRPDKIHMERVTIVFSDDHPPNMVRTALLEAALSTPGVLHNPPPQIHLRDLKEDSTYEAILYYNDYAMIDDIVDRYLTRAWYATNRHGIIFPYEDYRVYHSRGSEFDLGSTNPINEEDIIHQLQTLKTFNLSDSELELITQQSRVHRYGKGEMVLAEGQECQGLYVVLEGQVIKSMSDAHGKKKNLGYANPGDLLGVISVIRKEENIAIAIANRDCQIAILDPVFMRRVLKDNPEFSQKMEQDIEIRLKTINAIREQNPLNPNSLGDDKEQDMTLKDLLRKWQNEPRND